MWGKVYDYLDALGCEDVATIHWYIREVEFVTSTTLDGFYSTAPFVRILPAVSDYIHNR